MRSPRVNKVHSLQNITKPNTINNCINLLFNITIYYFNSIIPQILILEILISIFSSE
jgi:hypothetical protein